MIWSGGEGGFQSVRGVLSGKEGEARGGKHGGFEIEKASQDWGGSFSEGRRDLGSAPCKGFLRKRVFLFPGPAGDPWASACPPRKTVAGLLEKRSSVNLYGGGGLFFASTLEGGLAVERKGAAWKGGAKAASRDTVRLGKNLERRVPIGPLGTLSQVRMLRSRKTGWGGEDV